MTVRENSNAEATRQYFMLKKIINQIIDETGYLTSDHRINKFIELLSDKLFATTLIKNKQNNQLTLKFRDCICKHYKDHHANSSGHCLQKPCKCGGYMPI